jgi:signal transduction histidine kinase
VQNSSEPAKPLSETGAAARPQAGRFAAAVAKWGGRFMALVDRPIPPELSADPEHARRARLVTRFGVLGSLFGFVFAVFYLLIGHKWGTSIILLCSLGVAATPFLMTWKKSAELAGNFFALNLTLGFTGLCFVEGGLHGHAIAWLVSVPLCALLLAGRKSARRWALIVFAAAGLVAGLDLAGISLPLGYDPKWNSIVSAAGYLGLILFMFILGMVFEVGRARAFSKMQDALAELAATNEQLVHLNNEKNEFMGIAAHDLKNPLTVIVGSAELLTMSKDPERTAKFTGTILAAARRMRDLITNLLDANAIEQGKFIQRLERCDLRELVEQSVDHNQTSATKKNISIRVGLSEGLWAKADRAATLQILDNLISNALKYSPPNTTVHVHSLPEAEHVLITVRDEGPGISEADQKKLFQKFTRLSARPTGGESSTGLGLAIVKKLAEAMSGTVQCQSTLGTGATFILRLPAWPKDQHYPELPPAVKPRISSTISEPPPFFHSRN